MNLYIYGAGGLAYDTFELATRLNGKKHKWDEVFFIDDFDNNRSFLRKEVVSYNHAISNKDDSEIIVAVGEPLFRKQLFEKVKRDGFSITTLVDPSALISENVHVGKGTIILPFVCVSGNAEIGENVVVMPQTVFGHDTVICDGAIIGAQSFIGGHTVIGKSAYVASGSVISDRIIVGSDSVISLGSVVYKDVSDEAIVMGNPARMIRKNEEKRVFK